MKKEFIAVFQLSKTKIFEVGYYTLSNNKTAHFATSAAEFCRNKRDYARCGQAQKDVLKGYPRAMMFFKKWDKLHLHDLTEEEYQEMREDMERLADRYNCIIEALDESKRPYNPSFGFYRLAEWSKQEPKHKQKKTA